MERKYHGWIYRQTEEGFNDSFHVSWSDELGRHQKFVGRCAEGAAEAVDFFESHRGLGRVQLEDTPIGYRVFTEEHGEGRRG